MVALSKIAKTHRVSESSLDLSTADTATVDLSAYTGYNTLTIQIENNGSLTGTGTLALTGGIGGTDLTIPSGLFVTGGASFANISAASYNAIVVLKAGALTSLKLVYTESTASTGLLKIRILMSDVIV